MEHVLDIVERHGGSVIFVIVFLDQLGLPIPTVPILLALGALAGSGKLDPVSGLFLAMAACLCADFIWFQLGRWKGTRVLGYLCRIALEPDTCVSKTRDLFARHGVKSLLVAKFVPGFDTVAPPLAGILGVGVVSFVLWSAGGALIWLGTFGGLGFLFSDSLEELAGASDRFSSIVIAVIVGLTAGYVAWKYLARRRVLRSIRMARITPEELHQMILSGQDPVIIDVRSQSALDTPPFIIQGARLIAFEEIDARHVEIPREREIIVYCA
jgi:membrane protein DedA with SNARE-associated domain